MAGAPLLIAHRGGARLAPENTMAAFRSACEDWDADMLEMDVRATADGRIVVLHDASVDRTTNGSGAIADLRWDDVRELDAGYHFRDLDGDHSFRGRGVTIPLLEEVLESFPRVRLNVDAKAPGAAPGLVDLIRAFGAHQRVLVAAESEAHRASVRDYEGPWGASAAQIRRFFACHRFPVARAYTPRADALQVPDVWQGRQVVSPAFVRVAHAKNIPVHVWTIDEPEDMRRLIRWGVDGIQSDRLDLLAQVLVEEVGRPFPPALRGSPGGPALPPARIQASPSRRSATAAPEEGRES